SKEAHQKQKELKLERKAHKPNSETIRDAKKIWEQLRQNKLKAEEKQKLMMQMMGLIRGRVQDVIFKHDASRMIQACLKQGNSEQRNVIAEELKGKYLELSKSMYGKFLVMKVLEYCPKYRNTVLKELHTKITRLIRHKEASHVVEAFFTQFANAAQRLTLISEFYGPEFTLFNKPLSGQPQQTLDEVIRVQPEKKEGILKNLSETLSGTLDKGTLGHSIVHKVLLEYFTHADEKGVMNMVELLKEQVQEIVHTKEGAQVVMLSLSYSSPKDRKLMIKAMKPFLPKICVDEYAYLVLLRLFDVVDDTVLVGKAILGEITKNLEDLLKNKFGRRVILYLLVGRNTKYFFPETIKLLASGDEIRAKTSKKSPETRSKELLATISPHLITIVKEKAGVLMLDKLASQVVKEIMLHALGDKSEALNAILALVAENPEKDNHVVEDRFANRVLKALVHADNAKDADEKAYAARHEILTNIVGSPSSAIEPLNAGPLLLDVIRPYVPRYATNWGSFVIVALAEEPQTRSEVLEILRPHMKALEEAAADKKQKENGGGNGGSKLLVEMLQGKK
ncbi:armadillo-type protein, partial [Endogone sp. FLAS-F59071]